MSVLWKLTRNRFSQYAIAKLEKADLVHRSLLLYRLDLNEWKPGDDPNIVKGPIPYSISFYLGSVVARRVSDDETIGYMHYTSGLIFSPEIRRKMFIDGQYIYRVFTSPDMRRQGVGRNLLKRTLNEIVKETDGKARYAYAIIAVDNLPSRKLFEGAGFVPVRKLLYSRLGEREAYHEEDIPLRKGPNSSTTLDSKEQAHSR